tara:strand:- start:2441 stop:2557 length:117 start_codon:yes stop_codon:yes gene_type:complete
MGVCMECHEKIEKERDWAKEKGYLINRASSNSFDQLPE